MLDEAHSNTGVTHPVPEIPIASVSSPPTFKVISYEPQSSPIQDTAMRDPAFAQRPCTELLPTTWFSLHCGNAVCELQISLSAFLE
jgi:hypothetical protein